MAYPITVSDKPLVFDALPAFKTTWYYGDAPAIYTLGRAYFQSRSLCLSLSAFERAPAPGSRMALAVGGGGPFFLLSVFSPQGAALYLCEKQSPPALGAGPVDVALPTLATEGYAGEDEQGWYWGQRAVLGGEALLQAGVDAQSGEPFSMALFKYTAGGGVYGASFCPRSPGSPLCFDDFPLFRPVDY